MVLLIKALYGHPDAGGLWEQHLKKLSNIEADRKFPNILVTSFSPRQLLLSTYVDDLAVAGPTEAHEPFSAKLTSVVDVEAPEPIYRILGHIHVVMPLKQTDGHEECAAFRAKKGFSF